MTQNQFNPFMPKHPSTKTFEQQFREAVADADQSLRNLGAPDPQEGPRGLRFGAILGAAAASDAQPAQDPRFFKRLHRSLAAEIRRASEQHDRLLAICNRVGVLETSGVLGVMDESLPTSDIEAAEKQLWALGDLLRRTGAVIDDLERSL